MKAPRLLNRVYSLLHPLSNHLKASEEERDSRGWLLGFFVLSIFMYIDVIRNLIDKESFTGLPSTIFIWTMAILSLACLLLSRKWLMVLIKLFSGKREV